MKKGDGRADPVDQTAAEIEKEIASTRAELGRTVDALERQLAPHHLLGEGIDMITEYVGGKKALVGEFGETIRANRVPIAVIAAGIGWLVASNTGILDRRVKPNERVLGRTDEPADNGVVRGAIRAVCNAGAAVERYPLLIGLAGIVTGAVAATLLPPTKREHQWAERARGELLRKAEEIGHEAAGRVRDLAAPEATSEDRPHAP